MNVNIDKKNMKYSPNVGIELDQQIDDKHDEGIIIKPVIR
jgi:hypothetical protein